MTQPTLPAAVISDGNLKVAFVITIADPANPTATELNAVSTVDLSCYLTDYSPSTDEQVTTDDRLCSRQTFEGNGRYTDKLQITYVYRQQDPAAADNKAFSTLLLDATGFIVARWGAPFEGDFAAADVVDVMPAVCGVQMKLPGAQNETLKIQQNIRITNLQRRDVVVVS